MSLSQDIKLLTERPRIVTATVTANWQSGTATSGLAGANLFTVGAANEWYRLSEAFLVLSVFSILATVTVRAYLSIAGAVRTIVNEDWIVAKDGQLVPLIEKETELFGPLRVEVYSDQVADNARVVPYEYRIKKR